MHLELFQGELLILGDLVVYNVFVILRCTSKRQNVLPKVVLEQLDFGV